jgi:hypothetical protein
MEAVCSTLNVVVSAQKPRRRYDPEEQKWHIHRRENLKSHMSLNIVVHDMTAFCEYGKKKVLLSRKQGIYLPVDYLSQDCT